jgi:hypothetical protein
MDEDYRNWTKNLLGLPCFLFWVSVLIPFAVIERNQTDIRGRSTRSACLSQVFGLRLTFQETNHHCIESETGGEMESELNYNREKLIRILLFLIII